MEIGSKEWSNLIAEGAATFGLKLNAHHIGQFTSHAKELVRWTQRINITSITDPRDVAIKHFLDSLAPARFIASGASLLDIGSGGGFPGIPLKVLIPSLSVILIDGSRKKVNFLKHIIRTLKLNHIEALHIRAEALAADPSYRNRFDVITGRALSSLESFVGLAMPLQAPGGNILALQGQVDQRELNGVQFAVWDKNDKSASHDRTLSVCRHRYDLPFMEVKRSIVSVHKPPVGGR
jgi:16S rRNA (guanine527-N7)-methyltransferase